MLNIQYVLCHQRTLLPTNPEKFGVVVWGRVVNRGCLCKLWTLNLMSKDVGVLYTSNKIHKMWLKPISRHDLVIINNVK